MTQPDKLIGVVQIQSNNRPVFGEMRDYEKGSEVWTGEKWEHNSEKSCQEFNNAVFDYLNPSKTPTHTCKNCGRSVNLPPDFEGELMHCSACTKANAV